MKVKILFAAFLLSIILAACRNVAIGSIGNNVCKTLEKKTILYAIFVDSDATHPWSEYDINSTLDSIQISVDWIIKQANKSGVNLTIDIEHAHKNEKIPFKEKLRYETLSGTLFKYRDLRKGINLIDDWSDKVSKDVARTLDDDTSTVVSSKNRSNNRERMIAKLRNQYKTDNVAVLYFINNYYENEVSVAFHTASNSETEFAVLSTKETPVIAHEFLHLFGAWDLYESPFDRGFFQKRRKKRAMKNYPNEIMAFTHKRNIDSLEISPLTEYLIGWSPKLDKKESLGLIGRRWKLLEY